MPSIAIIGASLSGLRSAEAAVRANFDGEIYVFGDEPYPPYNRPPLSKEALEHDSPIDGVLLRTSFRDRISYELSRKVIQADLNTNTLTFFDGKKIAVDGIIAATGLRSRSLSVPKPSNGVFSLRSYDDMTTMRRALSPHAHVIIIGAGFIGCEVGATLTKMGHRVTIIAPESVPMMRPLGIKVGRALQAHHAKQGVTFALDRMPTEISGVDAPQGVLCNDGSFFEADLVIEAIGSIPNTEWLEGNDLDLDNGVLCDTTLRAGSNGTLFATGDIARFPNLRFDATPRRVEHWGIAVDSGRYAGKALATVLRGEPLLDEFSPMPAFWSDQFLIRIQSFGMPGLVSDESSISVLDGDLESEVAVGYFRDDILVGVVLIGFAAQHTKYRDSIGKSKAEL